MAILGDEAELFCIYYHITDEGNWEEEQTNILFKRGIDGELAEALGLPVNEMLEGIASSRKKVFEVRSHRIRPGLDNKILASWNGLMLKGLCEAYRAFDKTEYLNIALKNAEFIINNLINNERLTRVYKKLPPPHERDGVVANPLLWRGQGEATPAFLDDYANVIDAFIALYEVTFNEQWLNHAIKLTDNAITHYYDKATGIFFYTADDDEQLIARKSEIMDAVTPASNSVMARNLKKLGLLFDKEQYLDISAQLLRNIFPHLAKYGSAYSNWAMLLLDEVFGVYEVAIAGEKAEAFRIAIEKNYIPNKIILGGKKGSLPLLQDKYGSLTQIFICKDKTCGLPADNIAGALKQIEAASIYNR